MKIVVAEYMLAVQDTVDIVGQVDLMVDNHLMDHKNREDYEHPSELPAPIPQELYIATTQQRQKEGLDMVQHCL